MPAGRSRGPAPPLPGNAAALRAAGPRRATMLEPDRGLSFTIARVVQRLQGSSLHSQLERQARVSPALPLCPAHASLPRCPSPALCSRPPRPRWRLTSRGPGPRPLPPSLPVPLLSFLGGAAERSVWFLEPCLLCVPLGPKDFAVNMKTIRLKSRRFKYRS